MVVTRFAPSPTGYLHVGGARTALFNWLYARCQGGRFILRIEDTDTRRNTPTAMGQVINDLKWLGIEWDEGPGVEGPNGPYLQSQRRDIYDKYLKQLLEQSRAYYCFDSPDELKAMRDVAEKEKKNFVYPRPDPFPSYEDAEKARGQGRPVTVRFAVPQDEDIVVEDIVRGEVRFQAGEIGDFIIQKSDGFPTYHFAVVVDDELMEVTHVIRGQEHLMNTPGHQCLQKALGFRVPVYAHMSVTVSDSGGKLSKRERPKVLAQAIKAGETIDLEELARVGGIDDEEMAKFLKKKSTLDMPVIDAMADYLGIHLPEINVVDFFKGGYLPETMVNFLALLGWNPGDDREVMDFDELAACFDITRLAKSNSLFDRKKLLSFNTEHIRMLDIDRLLEHFKSYLETIESPLRTGDDALLKRLLTINAGAKTLAQIEEKSRFIFLSNQEVKYDKKSVEKILLKHDGLAILKLVGQGLSELDEITPESIEKFLRDLAREREVALGKVAQPLRVGICGTTVSPPIFDSVDMLGMDNTLERINIALEKFGPQGQ